MTVASVKKAISVFLRTTTPQLLCIRGKWGVGKTFVWNDMLNETKAAGSVALPYYCYVSLFGLQSIDEVRQTIFENRMPTTERNLEPSLDSLRENVKHYVQIAAKRLSRFSSYARVPYLDKYVANFSDGFRQIVALAVHDTIICFDDFERKKISTKDLLELVSQFREQKRSKAVIILNEDALSPDESAEFSRYFEKVIDIAIEFAPNAVESAEIALKGTDPVSQQIRENAVSLGISNIRIIKRIYDGAQELMRILAPFREETQRQGVHALVLMVWSKYADDAIPLKLIAERAQRNLMFVSDDERTEDEKKWGPKLEAYQFLYCDKLDLAILRGVEKGFFDEREILFEAKQEDERLTMAASRDAIHQAWQLFHGSFENNPDEVVKGILSAYKLNMAAASKGNIDDAVIMVRTLGLPEEATDLIACYLECHRGDISTVDDAADPFYPAVRDEEFRGTLAAAAVPPPRKPLKDVLTDIGNNKLKQDDLEAAVMPSADDYYSLFKELVGDELYLAIKGSLFWRRVINATEAQKEATSRALSALQRIGKECKVNALRIRKFSVAIDDDEHPQSRGDGTA